MMTRMARRVIAFYAAALSLLATPLAALAQDDEKAYFDARLEGYNQIVTLEGGSTALTWVVFIILAVIALGGRFKDAQRTLLD